MHSVSNSKAARSARDREVREVLCQSRDITIDTVSRKHERKTNTLRVACLRSGRGRRVSREARVSSRVAVDRPQTREIAWLASRCVVTCRRYDYVCLKIRSIGAIPSVAYSDWYTDTRRSGRRCGARRTARYSVRLYLAHMRLGYKSVERTARCTLLQSAAACVHHQRSAVNDAPSRNAVVAMQRSSCSSPSSSPSLSSSAASACSSRM
jgi:hypothetical protein